MKTALVVTISLAVLIACAWPAFGERASSSATSTRKLEKRVKKLERRVTALALLTIRAEVRTETQSRFVSSGNNGYYVADVSCPRGRATGGGARFPTNGYLGDHVIDSYPTFGGEGWHIAAASPAGPVTAYVVCAYHN